MHARPSSPSRPARIAVLLLTVTLARTTAAAPDWDRGLPAEARARVAPALAAELQALAPGAQVPIIVTLTEAADLPALNAEAIRDGLDRRERAAFVIPALKAAAEAGQAPFRADLALWEATKQVTDLRRFWIMDGFACSATQDVVRALALRSGVAEIAFDGQLELDRPVDEGPANAAPGQAEIGLRVVNAPALWALGYTGAGITVMNIDTGVAGGHVGLASRWLGNQPGVAADDAWFDPIQQNCATPCDYGSHGTHTMGIMTGLDAATQDTVGVAFGAHWIAAATIDVGAFPSTSFSIAAFEWALDPGPGATRGPADVISCSWQDPSLSVAQDCGPNGTYWAAIDGFETAGGAVTWSAGNAGSGAQSITKPKNRISSPVNHFATGNINGNNPSFPISSSSSRGPSACDGLTIKPEAVAPGSTIRSTVPSGYGNMSGTSMASPHAAGVIALLLDAFPWATGTDAKLAMIATARDLGTAGEDNTYGNGLIDAGAAYQFLVGAAALHEAESAPAAGITLGEAAPNPFHPATSLSYDLPSESVVTLKVYDHNGRAVATVTDQVALAAGRHQASWNGRTASGERAASGMYFFRLTARPAADASAAPVVLERRAILLK